MDVADFDYPLPETAIAQRPIEPRDAARLLVDRGEIEPPEHRHVRDLADLLDPGDLLVVNTTRVLPARLALVKESGGAVEVLLLERLDDGALDAPGRSRWEALVRPGRRLPPGTVVRPTGDVGLVVTIGDDLGDGRRSVVLDSVAPLLVTLDAVGSMPLPPYLTEGLADPERYQTVYSRRPASAAAPTAGLHLTPEVLDRCAARGIGRAEVELVVGLGTFRPMNATKVEDHVMHTEWFDVSATTLEAIARTRRDGGRVVAVGTTVVRALESAMATGEATGRTGLFIRRGHEFRAVDRLLTNFHLPRSSLLVLVDAFVGPRWRRLYDNALADGYRFLSFGDAMLLTRDDQRNSHR